MVQIPRLSTRNVKIGSAVGSLSVLLALVLSPVMGFSVVELSELPEMNIAELSLFLYILVGLFLLGSIPTIALLETHLVTPALVVLGLLSAAVYTSWPLIQHGGIPAGPPSTLDFYLLWWVAILGIALVVGGVEYGARSVAGHVHDPVER